MQLQCEWLMLHLWLRKMYSVSTTRGFKACEEAVRQSGVTADLLVAALVVCHGPDAFPQITWVVVIAVVLNALFVSELCLLDALF